MGGKKLYGICNWAKALSASFADNMPSCKKYQCNKSAWYPHPLCLNCMSPCSQLQNVMTVFRFPPQLSASISRYLVIERPSWPLNDYRKCLMYRNLLPMHPGHISCHPGQPCCPPPLSTSVDNNHIDLLINGTKQTWYI